MVTETDINYLLLAEEIDNFNTPKFLISKKLSLFPNGKTIVHRLLDYIQNDINTEKYTIGKYGEKVITLIIPDNLFNDLNPFFDKPFVQIELHFVMDATIARAINSTLISGYRAKNSIIINDKLFFPYFEIKLACFQAELYYNLAPILLHEFQHAYEDYCLLRKGYQGMEFKASNTRYHNAQEYMQDSDDWYKRAIGTIYYVISSIERGAFIAQSYSEIKQILDSGQVVTNANSRQIVEKLSIIQNIEIAQQFLNAIKIDNDNKILTHTNYLFRTKFQDINSAVDFIERTIINYKTVVLKKVGRIIADYQNDISGYKNEKAYLKESIRRIGLRL